MNADAYEPYDGSRALWAPDSAHGTPRPRRAPTRIDNRVVQEGNRLWQNTRSGLFVIVPFSPAEAGDDEVRALTVGDVLLIVWADKRSIAPLEVIEVRPCASPDIPTIRGRCLFDGKELTYSRDALFTIAMADGQCPICSGPMKCITTMCVKCATTQQQEAA